MNKYWYYTAAGKKGRLHYSFLCIKFLWRSDFGEKKDGPAVQFSMQKFNECNLVFFYAIIFESRRNRFVFVSINFILVLYFMCIVIF